MVEEGTISSEEASLPMDSFAWKETPVNLPFYFGDLLQPLHFVPISRERVVPTEWKVRSVFGLCHSKARVITSQAPQYWQSALISEFLDLANLSIRDEAALATNWIKNRPEGFEASESCIGQHDRASDEQFAENFDCTCQVSN